MNKFLKYGFISFIAYNLLIKPKSLNGIGKIHVYKFKPVYKTIPTKTKNGKTNFSSFRGKPGVYLIAENGKIVYVGYSKSDVYMAMMRHFYSWEDQRVDGRVFERVSYVNKLKRNRYTARIVTTTPKRAEILEALLIKKHSPRDKEAPRDNTETEFKTIEKNKPLSKQVLRQYTEAELEDVPF